jgi:glycine dehydrogenase
MGPICVAEHLAPFLPTHPVIPTGGSQAIDAVAAAPYGSASILLISWAYIKMLGGAGLSHSSFVALLNANYIASRLKGHYTLKYKNHMGRVAHELLIDMGEFEKSAGLKVTDFAKRLQVGFCENVPRRIQCLTICRTTASIHLHVLGLSRLPC